MSNQEPRFSPEYNGTFIAVLIQHAVLGVLAGMIMDNGEVGNIAGCSVIAYWILFAVIIIRRPKNPTKGDILVVKLGPLILFAIAVVLVPFVWSFQGGN
jgi:hypothetical protein